MLACLLPLKTVVRNPAVNIARFEQRLARLVPHQPDLICLPECSFTGYLWNEDDLARFAEPIPGPTTGRITQFARIYATFICFGLLEWTDAGVYNTAVLVDRQGSIILKHRKIFEKPPYQNGDVVAKVDTGIGRLGLLVCGDLFSQEVVNRLDPSLDLLLLPVARSFDRKSPDAGRWINEER